MHFKKYKIKLLYIFFTYDFLCICAFPKFNLFLNRNVFLGGQGSLHLSGRQEN